MDHLEVPSTSTSTDGHTAVIPNTTPRTARKRTANKLFSHNNEVDIVPKKQAKRKARSNSTVDSANCAAVAGGIIDSLPAGAFSREHLVHGVRHKKFKKVAFLTGAGISVAAGIPDFRTPKTGLYAQLKAFGLPHPEEIFSLEFLHHAPEPFYVVSNRYLQFKAKPVLAHQFIKKFADQGTLMMDYTQNIDGLELDAGIPPHLLVQAHGHMRSAHCSDSTCKAEVDMRLYTRHVKREEVLYCKICKSGIVKPDIVFFGEKLPKEFNQKFKAILKADLVFIMGTSLKVAPFSTLLTMLPVSTPLVVLNYTNPTNSTTVERENFLFLAGDIEANVQQLMTDIGWNTGNKKKPAAKRKLNKNS